MTMPSPRTNTSVFAVPRSIARSSENFAAHRLNNVTPLVVRSTTFPVEAPAMLSSAVLRASVGRPVVHEDVERALLPDAAHHRFDRVRRAHVAPYGLDLSPGLLGQFLGRLLKHVLAPATDHNVRSELEEAVAHRAAESRAATSHQNALALQQVELKHRILNSWPWPLADFQVRVSATPVVGLRMRSSAHRGAALFPRRAVTAASDVGPWGPRSETSPAPAGRSAR